MVAGEGDAERLARIEERINIIFQLVNDGFARVDADVKTAREQYPTRADITKGMQDAVIEARAVAREEANMAYERAAVESRSESDKAAAALKALETQTDRAVLTLSGRMETIREELITKIDSGIDSVLAKIEDAVTGRTVMAVLSAIAVVVGIAAVVSRFA